MIINFTIHKLHESIKMFRNLLCEVSKETIGFCHSSYNRISDWNTASETKQKNKCKTTGWPDKMHSANTLKDR